MMKRLLVLAALAALFLVPTTASAYDVNVGDILVVNPSGLPQADGGGGPFLVQDITKGGSFLSFCIELYEHLGYGSNETVADISQQAWYNGLGAPNVDPLDERTAYLYVKFRTVDFANASLSDDYQNAIWWIEGEFNGAPPDPTVIAPGIGYGSCPPGTGAAPYCNLSADARGLIIEATNQVDGGWRNNGAVAVINLGSSDNPRQDMLTMVPEPGSMMLLGSGLVALAGAVRRRIRK